MLAQFALIAFAIFGVLSLVIDAGYVRLAHVQMQTAADAASLEGLRLRNSDLSDGFAADCQRRIAARNVVRKMFADQVDAATGITLSQYGAGPVIDFEGTGTGDTNANQKIAQTFAFYKPNLQLNQTTPSGANLEYGDMVSGQFDPLGDPAENASYQRGDFTRSVSVPAPDTGYTACPEDVPLDAFGNPSWPQPPPMNGLTGVDSLAFLVRLRRTNNVEELDDVDGVSSGGPTAPLMFGRGTSIEGRQAGQDYSPRHDGLTVRATSIASARPALRVGLPAAGRNGVVPFTLDRAFYLTFNNGDPSGPPPVTASIDAATGKLSDSSGAVVGRLVSAADRLSIATVGSALPAPSMSVVCDPTKTPEENAIAGFGPVYTAVGPTATPRVIGFGRVEMVWPDCPGNPTSVQFFRHAQIVALSNATALLAGGLPLGLPPNDIPELMQANRDFASPTGGGGGLLVAGLAR